MSAGSLPTTNASRGGRKLLLLMGGLFAVPFVVTALLFAIDWRPAESRQHGEIVAARGESRPAEYPALPFSGLLDSDGKPLAESTLTGYWTLLVASPGVCTDTCQARLASVRRIHVALYKQMPRVKRVWLSTAPAADPALSNLRRTYPDLVVAAPAHAAWQQLLAPAIGGAAGNPRLFVIDPAGRVVMRYPEPFDPRGALRDIERLLKYSWIG